MILYCTGIEFVLDPYIGDSTPKFETRLVFVHCFVLLSAIEARAPQSQNTFVSNTNVSSLLLATNAFKPIAMNAFACHVYVTHE